MAKKGGNKWLHWVLSVAILAGLAMAVAKYLNTGEVLEALRSFNMAFVAPILLVSAFYLFLKLEDVAETSRLGLRLIDEAGIGMAPGSAFGPGGAPFMRLCFARKADDLREAARRLSGWLAG